MGQPRAPHVKKERVGEMGGMGWVVGKSSLLEILKTEVNLLILCVYGNVCLLLGVSNFTANILILAWT